jgi:hypothetical protein
MDVSKQSLSAGGLLSAAAGAGIAPVAPRASAVELHIDELVLHGFTRADRFAVRDAIERELMRVIAERGVPGTIASPVTIERLDAGGFTAKADAKPQAIGGQTAAALYRGLSSPLSREQRGSTHDQGNAAPGTPKHSRSERGEGCR